MKILKIISLALFLCAVPWAIHYNMNYDRYGAIDRPAPPVTIQIVTVDAGSINNTLKTKAAEYARAHNGVRIFVLPMTLDQIGAQEFDIRIVRENNILYSFITPAQTKEALRHCKDFLQKTAQELDGFEISIK